jgi:hypothetical protein
VKDLKQLKLDAALSFIYEWEMYLRSQDKYSKETETTWSDVREKFLEMRAEHALYDLFNLDNDLEDV